MNSKAPKNTNNAYFSLVICLSTAQ